MRILLTGASGFVASYLIPELQKGGHQLFLSAPHGQSVRGEASRLPFFPCDIRNAEEVDALIGDTQPEVIVHLGAISHVAKANEARAELSAVNVVGTHNLCAAASRMPMMTFLYVSTALVYGGDDALLRCSEATAPKPVNAYGMSKLAGEYVVQGFRSETFKTYCVRPFNHIGPGQSPDFVCTAFAKRVHEAPVGSVIPVGNLESFRDFSDVRDIVRAYRKIIELQPQEDLFVLGRGETVSIRSILNTFVEMSGKSLEVKVDPGLLRAHDDQVKLADCSRAKKVLDWAPVIPVEQSLRDIYFSLSSKL